MLCAAEQSEAAARVCGEAAVWGRGGEGRASIWWAAVCLGVCAWGGKLAGKLGVTGAAVAPRRRRGTGMTSGSARSVGARATRLREQAGACGELGRCVESNGRGERERSWAGLSVGFGPGWCGFSFSISIFLFQTLLKPS